MNINNDYLHLVIKTIENGVVFLITLLIVLEVKARQAHGTLRLVSGTRLKICHRGQSKDRHL